MARNDISEVEARIRALEIAFIGEIAARTFKQAPRPEDVPTQLREKAAFWEALGEAPDVQPAIGAGLNRLAGLLSEFADSAAR